VRLHSQHPLQYAPLITGRLFLIGEGIIFSLGDTRQDLFDAPFNLGPWQQHASATLLTAQAEIGTQAHHLPIRIPAGMLLAQT
jgi:hypothetical protein